jgi:hypothetical protein
MRRRHAVVASGRAATAATAATATAALARLLLQLSRSVQVCGVVECVEISFAGSQQKHRPRQPELDRQLAKATAAAAAAADTAAGVVVGGGRCRGGGRVG